MKKITLAITPGDPRGIGPEVTRKALTHLKKELRSVPVVIFSKKFPVTKDVAVKFIEPPSKNPKFQTGWAIEAATNLVLNSPNEAALITGPINKESFQASGYPFKGHTDFLASITHSPSVTMVLANDWFRVALVTNHCALAEVPKQITIEKVATTIEQAARFCRVHLQKKEPENCRIRTKPSRWRKWNSRERRKQNLS